MDHERRVPAARTYRHMYLRGRRGLRFRGKARLKVSGRLFRARLRRHMHKNDFLQRENGKTGGRRQLTVKHTTDSKDQRTQVAERERDKETARGSDGEASHGPPSRREDVTPGMEGWAGLQVPLPVIHALRDLGFATPTEIQQQAIPTAITEQCDLVGAAETGSGKTLAFAIPILHHVLNYCGQRVKHSTGGPRVKQGMGRWRLRESRDTHGRKVVDLNQVMHSPNGDDLSESDSEGQEEEMESSESEIDFPARGEDSDIVSGSSEDSPKYGEEEKSTAKDANLGLVSYRDNIPNDEFERMLAGGDVIAGSHDTAGDVTVGSHDTGDVIAGSHDTGDVIAGSHDTAGDVTAGSHDTAGDVTAGSHDTGDVIAGSHDTSYCGKLIALVLTPTRELALQVHSHISAAAKYTGIKVCAVMGGMAPEKQERLLRQLPPIVVATPGRLWKFISEGDPHLCSLDNLKFLVLDEADRMVEYGHFQELGLILDRVNGAKGAELRRTFVFSATLTLPRRSTERKRRKKNMSRKESLDNLMSRVGLGDTMVIDLTGDRGTVQTLTETKIMCTAQEKDLYLYFFLLVYPGRTLVFVNSIDCLQRVRSLLELLHLQPLPLHAHMQQRQRLKNLERFASRSQAVLIASDVAARGLDIPSVQHVIHYQVSRNSELYVHRSGRTARAQAEGLSVMLVGPEDLKAYRNICRTLNRDEELPNFPVELSYFKAIRQRVSLARQVDTILHRERKARKSNDWFRQSAEAMDIELDTDVLQEEVSSDKRELAKLQSLKDELGVLLKTSILPRSVSMTFPTRDENHKILARMQESEKEGKERRIIVAEELDALTVVKAKRKRT